MTIIKGFSDELEAEAISSNTQDERFSLMLQMGEVRYATTRGITYQIVMSGNMFVSNGCNGG